MDVVLTSFGIGMRERRTLFCRMPPLYLDQSSLDGGRPAWRFHIDYASLFMFDRVIVDERSYASALDNTTLADDEEPWLTGELAEAVRQGAAEYAEVLKALHRAGRLMTRDFEQVLADGRSIVERATRADLSDIPRWVSPIESAVSQWSRSMDYFRSQGREDQNSVLTEDEQDSLRMIAHVMGNAGHMTQYALETLRHWKKQQSPPMRKLCRDILRDYIYYANFNLFLSFDCQSPFLDWTDMQPIYKEKFRAARPGAAPKIPGQLVADESRKLFDFLFPYFVPRSPADLIKAVEDKRIDRLRSFVKDAVERGTAFDPVECLHILKDVLRLEHRAGMRRNITGWASLPLGFIPVMGTPVQKAFEELVNRLWSNRSTAQYSWFYLINEIDISARH